MKNSKISITLAATALVVALFAATPISQAAGRLVLGKNSVGTAQLKKNAVTTAKVKNGSLLASDFKTGQLPGGPQGPKGEAGPIGPSDAFVATAFGPISIVGWTTLKSITLPPGSYVLIGRVGLHVAQQHVVRCKFSPTGTLTDAATTAMPAYEVSLAVTDTLSLSSPTAVAFQCTSSLGATGFEGVVTAIKVGSLTVR